MPGFNMPGQKNSPCAGDSRSLERIADALEEISTHLWRLWEAKNIYGDNDNSNNQKEKQS